ncbi:carbonate dehydratase [Rhizophagus clarus]|uniref:Carbonic anhydrase n=1 Tax=Rhizophagus clarus TaxID=94130 RepID=A0A8H3L264_9GLOM|nr:carbonate dehydratase [Rhizophagus clarus]
MFMHFTNMADNNLQKLLDNNREWVESITKENPDFFINSSKGQQPKIVWFGCSDSRVPAETIVKAGPGEIFVHRNIANQFNHADLNSLSVLEYAVLHLKVEHVVVCGHYGCGGVLGSMGHNINGLVDNWLRNIKDVYLHNKSSVESCGDDKEKSDLLVELNVKKQVRNISATDIVQKAWTDGRKLTIHGWVYQLDTGLLKDLEVDVSSKQDLSEIYRYNC